VAIYYPAPRKPEPSAPPQPKWQEPPIDGATMKERIVANSEWFTRGSVARPTPGVRPAEPDAEYLRAF
jgi:hypothetical protein